MNLQSKLILKAIDLGYRVDREGVLFGVTNNIMKVTPNKHGYLRFSIRYEGGKYKVLLHRIQAYQKYREQVFNKNIVVRHKDGNKLNNSWSNILIGTASDNRMDIPKDKRRELASNPKHSHKAIIKDRELGLTYQELMLKYNISSKGTISFIINKSMSLPH